MLAADTGFDLSAAEPLLRLGIPNPCGWSGVAWLLCKPMPLFLQAIALGEKVNGCMPATFYCLPSQEILPHGHGTDWDDYRVSAALRIEGSVALGFAGFGD